MTASTFGAGIFLEEFSPLGPSDPEDELLGLGLYLIK
jgi:hypothetical protein